MLFKCWMKEYVELITGSEFGKLLLNEITKAFSMQYLGLGIFHC